MAAILDKALAHALSEIDAPTLIIEKHRQAIQAVLKKLAYSLPIDLSPQLYLIAEQLFLESAMRLHSLHTWQQQLRSHFMLVTRVLFTSFSLPLLLCCFHPIWKPGGPRLSQPIVQNACITAAAHIHVSSYVLSAVVGVGYVHRRLK